MIRRICWSSDSSLSGLELDLSKQGGGIYNTIVLVGENGSGKTRIMDSISGFLNCNEVFEFDFFEYDMGEDKYCLKPNPAEYRKVQHDRYKNGEKSTTTHYWKMDNYNKLQEDPDDVRNLGCAYSRARTGFKTDRIDKSTNLGLDEDNHMEDDDFDYTSVKQIMVDVETQDNSDWMELSRNHDSITIEQFLDRSRMSRFRKAFNSFFENIKFERTDVSGVDKRIVFNKNGISIDVDSLSTGEKQVVFRGAYLLQNSGRLMNGVVLIDEPELSMHPKWQAKILDYYRDLFKVNGIQNTQMIIATHSDHVLRSAMQDPENVKIILLENISGKTEMGPIEKAALSKVNSAEINFLIFGMCTTEYHDSLFAEFYTLNKCNSNNDVNKAIWGNESYNSNLDLVSKEKGKESLPVYVRNAIHHPESSRSYNEEQLRTSIELLRELILKSRPST